MLQCGDESGRGSVHPWQLVNENHLPLLVVRIGQQVLEVVEGLKLIRRFLVFPNPILIQSRLEVFQLPFLQVDVVGFDWGESCHAKIEPILEKLVDQKGFPTRRLP